MVSVVNAIEVIKIRCKKILFGKSLNPSTPSPQKFFQGVEKKNRGAFFKRGRDFRFGGPTSGGHFRLRPRI